MPRGSERPKSSAFIQGCLVRFIAMCVPISAPAGCLADEAGVPEPIPRTRRSAIRDQSQVFVLMIKWILILLVIAAVASLLGFGRLAGAAATGAQILIGIVLVLFLLVIFGVIAIA